MYPQTGNIGNIDANVARILEETIAIVNDVDQRLSVLRNGIAQTFPQLAHVALAGNARNTLGMTGGLGDVGTLGLQGRPGLGAFPTPFLQGFGQQTPFAPFGPVGIPPFLMGGLGGLGLQGVQGVPQAFPGAVPTQGGFVPTFGTGQGLPPQGLQPGVVGNSFRSF